MAVRKTTGVIDVYYSINRESTAGAAKSGGKCRRFSRHKQCGESSDKRSRGRYYIPALVPATSCLGSLFFKSHF